ncbi:MAG: transcription elongation factor GreA [Candidatus Scalindua sp.]|nr:transcription elongation factor GreA [Candidatus Scalindua sp.]
MERVYMVQENYEKLKKELDYLKTDKRIEVQEAIGKARAHGDLRENAEYDAAREAQGLLEAKIRKLEDDLARAEIVDSSKIPKDTVCFGAKVELEDLETGEIENYQLVGAGDDDPMNGKILVSSPVAKALLGGKINEELEVDVPMGKIRYKVLKIEY